MNNQLSIVAKNCRLNPRDPNRRLHHLVPPNQIQFNSREIKDIHPDDLNLNKLSLHQDGSKSRQRDQDNHYSKPRNLLETIFSLTDGQKLLIFLNLRRQLANLANHFPQYSDFANNLSKFFLYYWFYVLAMGRGCLEARVLAYRGLKLDREIRVCKNFPEGSTELCPVSQKLTLPNISRLEL